MGYYVQLRDSKFFIAKKDFPRCMEALVALASKPELMGGLCSGNGVTTRHAWVNMDYVNKKTLSDMIDCWRWNVYAEESGDIINIEFHGQKLGDDEALFRALAPFVKVGSYIDMEGEDGALWRWAFTKKGFVEKSGRVIYR